VPLAGCPAQSDSKTKTGWTVGWGSEFGLTPNVSVKSKTLYFDLGSDRYNMAGIFANIQCGYGAARPRWLGGFSPMATQLQRFFRSF
jgi:opacity protein-like surface antigen